MSTPTQSRETLTADQIRRNLQDITATEEMAVCRHKAIVKALQRHDGKKITRRMNTDLAPIKAKLAFRYGMIYVSFDKPGTYETYDHLLAYDSNPVLDLAKFEEFDACYGRAAEERIPTYHAVIRSQKPEQAAAALAEFQKAARAFHAATAEFRPYPVQEAAKATLNELFSWRIS